LPEESEEQKKFREDVTRFFNKKYEEFDAFASKQKVYYNNCSWLKVDVIDYKREFIIEVAGSIYKAFEMDFFDSDKLKKMTVERTRILFPEERAHVTLFNLILDGIFKYVAAYETSDECDKFLEKFEMEHPNDKYVCKFVWIIQNFEILE